MGCLDRALPRLTDTFTVASRRFRGTYLGGTIDAGGYVRDGTFRWPGLLPGPCTFNLTFLSPDSRGVAEVVGRGDCLGPPYYAGGSNTKAHFAVSGSGTASKSAGRGSTRDSGSGTNAGTSAFVSFSRTETIRHADGRVEQKKSTVLVDRDVIESYGDPVAIRVKNGYVAIDRNSRLQYTPGGAANWNLKKGVAYVDAKSPTSVSYEGYAGTVVAAGRGPSTVQNQFGNQEYVRSYGGAVTVTTTDGKKVTIHNGEQAWQNGGGLNTSKFKLRRKPFWKNP